MAIRPVDLQLAYLAAPQNAAIAENASTAPQIAQQAGQAAFAAQLRQREESIEQTAHAEGNIVRPRGEGSDERGSQEHNDERRHGDHDASGVGFAGEGEHFIDVTA